MSDDFFGFFLLDAPSLNVCMLDFLDAPRPNAMYNFFLDAPDLMHICMT